MKLFRNGGLPAGFQAMCYVVFAFLKYFGSILRDKEVENDFICNINKLRIIL